MYYYLSAFLNEFFRILLILLLTVGPISFYVLLALLSPLFIKKNFSILKDEDSKIKRKFNKNELTSAYNLYKIMEINCKRVENALNIGLNDYSEIFFKMDLEERPIWKLEELPNNYFEKIKFLEENHKMLVKEFEKAFKKGSLWTKNENYERKTSWFTYFLIKDGSWQEERCHECPQLVNLFKELNTGPLLNDCIFGNAYISMLPANSSIPEHIGVTNVRLRIHYGLEIPSGETREYCYMTVGNEKFHWFAGKATIINTSFYHSVSSVGCSEDRIVLIIDFWNPSLNEEEKNVLRSIFPPITK